MKIVFRVDGNSEIGLGHFMRCLSLAKQCGKEHDIWFLSQEVSSALLSLLQQANVALLPIFVDSHQINNESTNQHTDEQSTPQEKEAIICLETLALQGVGDVDLLIVDHYGLSDIFCSKMRDKAKNILVIDDLANRPHDCDILLDQNFFEDAKSRYKGLLPEHCITLLGPQFAILRDEFYQKQGINRRKNHLVVCFGGSDPMNLTERVVDILISLKLNTITADIVVGSGYNRVEQLEVKVKQHENMTLYVDCPTISRLMHRGSIMIGAGGSMHWERAHCGIPGLIITLAENQRQTTQWLDKNGCCVWLGDADDIDDWQISQGIEAAINSPKRMQDIATNAMNLVGKATNSASIAELILERVRGTHEAN